MTKADHHARTRFKEERFDIQAQAITRAIVALFVLSMILLAGAPIIALLWVSISFGLIWRRYSAEMKTLRRRIRRYNSTQPEEPVCFV